MATPSVSVAPETPLSWTVKSSASSCMVSWIVWTWICFVRWPAVNVSVPLLPV